ncbi:unnamed protein product [Candida verbasci]|uniref:GPI-anchored protein n=1 Tax=Candida verbasci TaxID=1227364 RepID=A0A9W4TT10_9ASCO|nr:unnamed protein product [Candida verbasci]
MKFSTVIVSGITLMSGLVSASPMSPESDPFALDVAPRDLESLYSIKERDLLSTAESLLSEINVTSILDSVDWESVAGFANNLLTENNNVQYLDDLLNFVGDTDLVPFLISFIISNNSTRAIAYDVVVDLLGSGKIDLTPVFVALKNSGLAYDLIADLIENPNTLPFIEQVVGDLFSGTSLASLFGGSGSSNAANTVIATTTRAAQTSIDSSLPTVLYSAGAISGASGASGSVNINTNSLASLFSQAATEVGTGASTAQATSNRPAATTSAATTSAANNGGATTSINFASISGPAFSSLPPSQFGQGPTTINYSVLGSLTAVLGGSSKREYDDNVEKVLSDIQLRKRQEDEVEKALKIMKRDNIEDLLTTIFSSVARSNVLNTTIEYLVTDSRFESSVVYLLQGLFSDLGSTLSGLLSTDWSSLAPLVNALLDSGLLSDLITRALNDPDLKNAIVRDFEQLFKKRDEILKREQQQFNSNSTLVAFTTPANSSVPVITHDPENFGISGQQSNLISVLAAMGLSALML